MKRVFRALILVAAASVPVGANAGLAQLSSLFVFGDSLSDGGNSGLLSSAATSPPYVFPPPPYAGGRYSNGPVAVEYLWEGYNPGDMSFKPSLGGGTNYAIGGATSGLESFNEVNSNVGPLGPIYAQKGSAWQLEAFADQAPNFDPATSLFVVWQFPNDLFYLGTTGQLPGTVPGSPGGGDVISNAIANILTIIQTLAAAGAQHFLVPNLVDLGSTPDFLNDPFMTAVSNLFNANLSPALSWLDATLPSIEIVQFDTNAAFKALIANPADYGLTVTDTACIADPACDPDTWLFWDGVHPTTKVHEILGAQFMAAVPEPATLVLFVLGLFGISALRRRQSSATRTLACRAI